MHLPQRFSHVAPRAFPLAALALLAAAAPVTAGPSVGATDVLVEAIAEPASSPATMDIASNGDIYLAGGRLDEPASEYIVTVYRSQDGGESWAIWGAFSQSQADGAPQPNIHIAEGNADRVFIAYHRSGNLWVAYADLGAGPPTFQHQLAIDAPSDVAHAEIVSDAIDYPPYFLYVVATENVTTGDVWFTRSTNFGASWETEYVALNASGTSGYSLPDLAYGGGVVHCTARFFPEGFTLDGNIHYRRLLNFGAGGLADWGPVSNIGTNSDDLGNTWSSVAASNISSNVVIAAFAETLAFSSPVWTWVRTSSDGGASWSVANQARILDTTPRDMVALPSGGFAMVTEDDPEGAVNVQRAADASPLNWSATRLSDPRSVGNVSLHAPALDFDITRGEQVGVTWLEVAVWSSIDSIMFDAEWRAATGYPSVAAGFPVPLGGDIIVSPVLGPLDGDPDLEILVGTADGMLHAYNSDGTTVPGWPVNLGSWPTATPRNGTIAVGDLNGDGQFEVAAGDGGGMAAVYRNDGTPYPGWPKTFGNDPVFVSIGVISNVAHRNVVVCTGKEVYVYEPDGSLVTGFPATLSGTVPGPAAIGDLDDDGTTEIVVAAGTHVDVVSNTGVVLLSKLLSPGDPASAQVSLADMDLNGDLEIAAPTTVGRVHLFDYPGGADLAGWPITTPTGNVLTAIGLADISGTGEPEVIFAERDSTVYMYHYNGAANTHWPKHTGDGWFLFGAPTIDFVEDLFSADVLIGSRDSRGHAFRNTAGTVPGWPRNLGDRVEVSPASGDVDHDGNLEVVFGGLNNLWMIDVNQTMKRNEPDAIWPMMGYNAQRTSCLACEPDAVVAVGGPRLPQSLEFSPPTPNPSAGHQLFRFALARQGHVRIAVYDPRGRLVRVALDRGMHAGPHVFDWDGRDGTGRLLAPGVYFARLDFTNGAARSSRTQRLVVLR